MCKVLLKEFRHKEIKRKRMCSWIEKLNIAGAYKSNQKNVLGVRPEIEQPGYKLVSI